MLLWMPSEAGIWETDQMGRGMEWEAEGWDRGEKPLVSTHFP